MPVGLKHYRNTHKYEEDIDETAVLRWKREYDGCQYSYTCLLCPFPANKTKCPDIFKKYPEKC